MLGQHFAGGPGKEKSSYDILADDFCLYCQRPFSAPQYMHRHVATKHPGSYADYAIREAKARRDEMVAADERMQLLSEVCDA